MQSDFNLLVSLALDGLSLHHTVHKTFTHPLEVSAACLVPTLPGEAIRPYVEDDREPAATDDPQLLSGPGIERPETKSPTLCYK